ncbi:MAG: hypothetical protein ACW98U_10375 [Candidatus Thorarchaeota archaeon]|jgi:hypothetical protein
MSRKDTVKMLIVVFGFILLLLTVIEYIISTFSITTDPVLMYLIQVFYLLSIVVFLLLIVIYLEIRNR